MSVLKISLLNTFRTKNVLMECEKPFYKKVSCLHVRKRTFSFFNITLIGYFAYFRDMIEGISSKLATP